MLEGDRHCIDVLTQISTATRALQEVALSRLDDHLRADPDLGDVKLDELATAPHRTAPHPAALTQRRRWSGC
jgi:DNA-binding FrmR family transcriptional regulator